MQGDVEESVKSPPPTFTSCGFPLMLPLPAMPPCTQHHVVFETPVTWFAVPCAPPGPVLKYTIELPSDAPAPPVCKTPAAACTLEVLPTIVQSRICGVDPEMKIAPPPPAPV